MPWHETWFYVDWMLDDMAEDAAAQGQPFDINSPWVGGHLTADIAGALGAEVREID